MNPILIINDDLWPHIATDLTLGVPLLRLTCKSFATMFATSLTFYQKVAFSYYCASMAYRNEVSIGSEERRKLLAKVIVQFRMFHVYREIARCKERIHLCIAREWERECAILLVDEKKENVVLDYVTNILTLANVNLGKSIFINERISHIPLNEAVSRGSVALVSVLLQNNKVYENVNLVDPYTPNVSHYLTAFGRANMFLDQMRKQHEVEEAWNYYHIVQLLQNVPGVVELVRYYEP